MADAVTGPELGGLETGIGGLTGEDPGTPGSDGTAGTIAAAAADSGESPVFQAADPLANDSDTRGDAGGDALAITGVGEAGDESGGATGDESGQGPAMPGADGMVDAGTVQKGPVETGVQPSYAMAQAQAEGAAEQAEMSQSMAHDEAMMAEHMAMLDLLKPEDATHVAIKSGDWSDAATWEGGRIPDQDADVFIPMGVEVVYDVSSEAELHYVRVDGCLHFATDINTKLVLDTLVTNHASTLTIGTADQPVEAGVSAQIIIAADGPIDLADDPTQISRGVITHGTVRIVGEEKADFLKAAVAPQAGDSALIFTEAPQGWQVGDKLVVAAASNQMDQRSQQIETYEDEVVTIRSITANGDGTYTVALDQTLQYDHVPPQHQSDAVLQIPVANYTRNVFIGSQTDGDQYLGDGNSVPIEERGHVMFMHNDDVVVQNAEFFELGRTDKSILTSKAVDILREKLAAGEIRDNFEGDVRDFLATEAAASEANVAGRYALHFHRTGTDDLDNPAIAEGNAIWGSPGWGMVHHDANVNMISNAVFGTVGAGMVAEAGNETGIWADNIVIQTTGKVDTFNAESSGDPFHPDYVSDTLDDTFRQGEAYAMKSRLLEIGDNVAASANGAGFSFWPQGVYGPSHIQSGGDAFNDAQGFDPFYGQTDVDPAVVPTRDFSGNEVIGSRHALNTSSNKTDHEHDMDVVIEDLLAWNVDQAIMSFYQHNYIIKDSIFIKGTGNAEQFEFGGFIGENGAATHIHDPTDFKLVNNHWEGWDVVTREPIEIIVGNTVVGSTLSAETGPGGIYREGFTADNDTIDYLDNASGWTARLPNPIGTITGQVNVAKSDLVMTKWFDPFLVYVERTDTIGDQTAKFGSGRDAGFRGAGQSTWWEENALNKGYYERDGKIFLVIELALGDRVTGSIGVIDVAIELRFLESEPGRMPNGAVSNGALPGYFDANGVGGFRLVDKRVLDAPGNQLTRPTEDPADPPADDPSDPPADDPAPNTAPVAGDDGPFTVEAGASIDIAVAALLANDQDADGDALVLGTVSASGGTVERLDVGGTDTLRFTADAGTGAGTASLTYTVS
ncbi:MAG: G8 domain-containing protein, partial [Pseudomonadota bacterium]